MSESFDIVVIGGGISGVSLAARLAPHGRVAVLEAESHLGTQSTGRSAALLVDSIGSPEIRALSGMSRGFFETPPEGFCEAPLSSGRRGVVYATAALRDRLRSEYEVARRTAVVEWLDEAELLAVAPLLRPGVAVAGFYEPNARDLDVSGLLQGFARLARRQAVEIIVDAPVRGIARQNDAWRVEAGGRTLSATIIANAAGAWADVVAELAGVRRIGLQPMRRTAATVPVPDEIAERLPTHPFVTAVDESYYFKPETGAIMVSLSEETPSEPCDAYPEDIDVATALDRFHSATIVPPARPRATWAGLRTFSPDRRPVIGFDPETPGFFWYAGQGGYGIQTSPALSALGATLLTRAPLDPKQAPLAKALGPARFSRAGA